MAAVHIEVRRFRQTFIFISFLFLFAGCVNTEEVRQKAEELARILPEKNYEALLTYAPYAVEIANYLGQDSSYFLGLHFLDAGDERTAERLFKHGIEKTQPSIAKLCREGLTLTGSPAQRQKAAEEFYKLYPEDNEARALFAERLFENGKYKEALSAAEAHSDTENTENRLSRVRLLAQLEINDPNFLSDFELWFSGRAVSGYHKQFLSDLKEKVRRAVPGTPEGTEPTDEQARTAAANNTVLKTLYDAIDKEPITAQYLLNTARMRADVYNKEYGKAAATAQLLINGAQSMSPFELSDMGKALLYNGTQYTENAALLDKLSSNTDMDTECRFMTVFYAGRLHDRADALSSAAERYRHAIDITQQPERRDTALWYYLITLLKISPEDAIAALAEYGPTWHDPSYFSDFLEKLSAALFDARKWDIYYMVYRIIEPFADPISIAQYAYVSGRLIEEKLITSSVLTSSREKESREAFETAFRQDHSGLYYHFLAAGKLNRPVEDSVFRRRSNPAFRQNKDIETLLMGYADYGFPEKVYPEALKNINNVSLEIASKLTQKVSDQGINNPKLYADALRLITSAMDRTNSPITLENLKLLYPRPYLGFVTQASDDFFLNQYLIYGLMRSESFFDKDIVSYAGAIGLTQLMRATAGDIARKLKVEDYNLLDPATNIRFGSFYLAELMGRLDGVPILSLFAYNAGLTRVRNWLRASGTLPLDLFLESVPITETREYGRKVLTASALYGYLYYDKTPREVVSEIFPNPDPLRQ